MNACTVLSRCPSHLTAVKFSISLGDVSSAVMLPLLLKVSLSVSSVTMQRKAVPTLKRIIKEITMASCMMTEMTNRNEGRNRAVGEREQ